MPSEESSVTDDERNDTVRQFQESIQSQPSTSPSALARARRLTSIVFDQLIGPVSTSLLKKGWPTDMDSWDEFWSLPASDSYGTSPSSSSLADRVATTLEDMGPTYVKFGQALASRPDIVPRSLARSLATLQDQMQPFDTTLAKSILQKELSSTDPETTADCDAILASLTETPVAAASIGQVYQARLANGTKVAIKVQRPGIRNLVEQDAVLLLRIASWLEALPGRRATIQGEPSTRRRRRLIQTDLTGAIREFMARLREELDYRNEARNLATFASLYSHRRPPSNNDAVRSSIQVVVPIVYSDLCTENVLVMEWIDGTKLVDLETEESSRVSLQLIEQGIDCTLSQLLETGVLHADPHGGNLWKVSQPPPPQPPTSQDHDASTSESSSTPRLGYVDFGLLATVPVGVRDGLVCAVAELVFERNVTAVAQLFGELALLPDTVLANPSEMLALGQELTSALDQVLIYPTVGNESTSSSLSSSSSWSRSTVPQLRFDKLLNVLSRLVPRFQFQLPPYFLNNARALSTLEGMAREINPKFNVLQFLYPYALRRILANPSGSPVVKDTLNHLITNRETGFVDYRKIRRLVQDVTLLTGYSSMTLFQDVLSSRNGFRLIRRILQDPMVQLIRRQRLSKSSPSYNGPRRRRRRRPNRRVPADDSLFRL